ncbi:hypothetical protein OIU85_028024 [Salix viminalis]|uniref:Uncharacterized protein n=1 Tax=Salix viminalis TaxID=40686 RepID=A0A9Q0QKJ8_SALVM|nr:hypothetical protein OIU85_028024 [Salix viminalis]
MWLLLVERSKRHRRGERKGIYSGEELRQRERDGAAGVASLATRKGEGLVDGLLAPGKRLLNTTEGERERVACCEEGERVSPLLAAGGEVFLSPELRKTMLLFVISCSPVFPSLSLSRMCFFQ